MNFEDCFEPVSIMDDLEELHGCMELKNPTAEELITKRNRHIKANISFGNNTTKYGKRRIDQAN